MRVCCSNRKPILEMSELHRLACNHDHCVGPIEVEDYDLLLVGFKTFNPEDVPILNGGLEKDYQQMTHTFRHKDIDEIFVITDPPNNTLLHISYLGPTEETFYTRVDLVRLLDIIDGKEEGVMRK